MICNSELKHPTALTVGNKYLWVRRLQPINEAYPVDVRLVAFGACPAVVFVRDEFGVIRRCHRDDLFTGSP
jgi:hypothetical protein